LALPLMLLTLPAFQSAADPKDEAGREDPSLHSAAALTDQEKTTIDADGDFLPDPLERILGTAPDKADMDEDGATDGVEFLFRSDPAGIEKRPGAEPAMRLTACASGTAMGFSLWIYPWDPALIEEFRISIASREILARSLNLTPLLPFLVSKSDYGTYASQEYACHAIELPSSLLSRLSPFSLAVRARIAGEWLEESLDIAWTDSGWAVWRALPGLERSGYFASLDGDDPPSYLTNQVCRTSMEIFEAKDGVVDYVITKADCYAMAEQHCNPASCRGSVGNHVIAIDPGLLEPWD